ncbi:MAG: hypothetical protein O7E49_14495 [Gemmatimonadetes bacterium]|nr:hypothetical protein [Gemmatimonadota bacterium]
MAAPLLLVTAVASVCYAQSGRRGWLAGAMAALVLASVFRFQAGAIVVVLLVLPVIRRQWGDLIVVLAVGLAGFLLTGWVDWLLRGGFHISLRRYLDFNIGQSSSFGVSPWYNYTLLLLAASLPPVLVSRYRGFDWRSYLRLLWPAIALFGVFVIVHSMTPHKEDRFMAPIMPVLFVLLAPLSAHLWRARPRGWRTLAFVAINATMIVLLVAVPAQYNVIGPVRYFRTHPTITRVWAIQPSMEAWPVAYSESVTGPGTSGHSPAMVTREALVQRGDRRSKRRPRPRPARRLSGSSRVWTGHTRTASHHDQPQTQHPTKPDPPVRADRVQLRTLTGLSGRNR